MLDIDHFGMPHGAKEVYRGRVYLAGVAVDFIGEWRRPSWTMQHRAFGSILRCCPSENSALIDFAE